MSGGKGSKTTTTTQTNPMQAAQMPFVTQGWEQAKSLYDAQREQPGSTIADWGLPWMKQAYNNIAGTAQGFDEWMRPTANNMWTTGGQGTVYNSPAYGYFQNMAQNQTVPQQQYADLGGWARQIGSDYAWRQQQYAPQLAANNNLGMSQLGATAQGDYLNGNPHFAAMVQNALDPITRNFQTAISPTIDANFMNSGRYGSGAMLGQRENAQTTLADQLAKTSSNMYGQNYANERQQQLAAAQNYGQLYNQGLTGASGLYGAAANTWQQGLQNAANYLAPQLNAMTAGAQGLQGGYQAGNAAALQGAQLYPQIAEAQLIGPKNLLGAGQGVNAIQQAYIDEPYNMLDRYLKQIGAVQGGSSTTQSPYYTNPFASAMSGITGGMDIMQKMGGMGGLGGSSGGYPATINSPSGQWVNGSGMGSGIYTNMSNGYTSDQSGSGFPGIPQVASGLGGIGSAVSGIGSMMGGWIVCTELVKQGRMPKRYWAIGSCAFMRYPEVGKRGYHFWGIPLVRHLRRKPYSLLSRIACAAFNWRAEDLAARRGIKGARKLLRGRMVTWVLYPICMALGTVLPAQDWQQVYDDAGSRAAG